MSYTPCKACGSTLVNRAVVNSSDEPDKEWVIVTCYGCENRRSGYARKKTQEAQEATRTQKAWDLIGFDGPGYVRIKGGRALYEAVMFTEGLNRTRVLLARVDVDDIGLKQVNRYVDPDTELEIVNS